MSRLIALTLALAFSAADARAEGAAHWMIDWGGPGWYQFELSIDMLTDDVGSTYVIKGPFSDSSRCNATLPPISDDGLTEYECRQVTQKPKT